MTEFPHITTNIWDVFLAVPLVLIGTQLLKYAFRIPPAVVPTVAVALGLLISVFISHPKDLPAGLFMGTLYGAAAVSFYVSTKLSIRAYRER
ncbi:hypothetical protein [Edaphobacillus lindanitolerans]|uniref:Holin n=1 Tax=Edaphobacillus lindanitolerans TaxID=550447 RepID=A0A1U7PP68_9BACI|nr:hypothetical protein [Edaphobacillus lindanitolerans]SIT75904.1 hypothetical protein SAMN05428946_1203 [Edaphobacillus lindanitolerans]